MASKNRGNSTTIGQRVRAARLRALLSQRQVAIRAGLTQAVVSRIERGETRDPGVLMISAIARVLGLTIEDLIAGTAWSRTIAPESSLATGSGHGTMRREVP
jgi:transcriptional regulator with XRE-family HTH domain